MKILPSYRRPKARMGCVNSCISHLFSAKLNKVEENVFSDFLSTDDLKKNKDVKIYFLFKAKNMRKTCLI